MEFAQETYKKLLENAISIDTNIIPKENAEFLKGQIVNNLCHGGFSCRSCPHHYFGKDAFPGEVFCRENVCAECWNRKIDIPASWKEPKVRLTSESEAENDRVS